MQKIINYLCFIDVSVLEMGSSFTYTPFTKGTIFQNYESEELIENVELI